MPCRVFISHAAIEEKIATALRDLLCDVFSGLSKKSVWFTSDRSGALDARRHFVTEITTQLRGCAAAVAILSPVSKDRAWPLWESGYAHALQKGPVIFTFAATGSISGRLESPLDAQQQYDGTSKEQVAQALQQIAKMLREQIDAQSLSARIDEFLRATELEVLKCRNASLSFNRKITLVLTEAEYQHVQINTTIPDSAVLHADDLSLHVFSIVPSKDSKLLVWKDFLNHLENIETPWPSSSTRWAKNLAGLLKKAKGDRLVSDSEALPLYYSLTMKKSLRPALTKRTEKGGTIEFEIDFIDLPKELTIRPAGDLGILFHYLDFCRMMRWGVLESSEILDIMIKPDLGRDAIKSSIKVLLTRIANIRTEFWNRGIPKDALIQAIERPHTARIIEMLRKYHALIEPLDPNEQGDGPITVPTKEDFLDRINQLSQTNKEFFMLVSGAIHDAIQKL